MTTAPSPPKPSSAPTSSRMKMPGVQRTGQRVVLVAIEGWGKTTIGAHAPDPVMVMAPGEGGYLTLLGRGLVPECPIIQPTGWPDLLDGIGEVAKNPQG